VRTLCSALMLISAIGCSSSTNGTASLRMPCEDRFSTLFTASQSAVIRLGGLVVHANRTSGSILGRIEADDFGFGVELTITLSRLPDNVPGTLEPLTVSVRAIEPGVSDPDLYRAEELRKLEEEYLALVRDRATCGNPY
jgi:hypothetical protein